MNGIEKLFSSYFPAALISDILSNHSEKEAFDLLNQLLVTFLGIYSLRSLIPKASK
jgi:hypothetical protein